VAPLKDGAGTLKLGSGASREDIRSSLQRRPLRRASGDLTRVTALRAGGQDNGAPGLRPIYGADYYAAFIIDPDGYRIEAYYGPGER
jgi:hypothetical protein